MKRKLISLNLKSASASLSMLLLTFGLSAQTNVFDDVIATSPNHTLLEAALIQEGLDVALQNPAGTLTVFAPDDAAFTALATALGTDINGLLANPDLTDILLYHVLGAEVVSGSLTNGQIATPLNTDNTLKVTLDGPNVFINHAQVNAANLQADNGVVHSIGAVLLPVQTVADVALGSTAHTTLVAAVIEARLLPALTNPLSQLTVFAPTNDAFAAALSALGLTAGQLLASPDLADILLYHVLGAEVVSGSLTNGQIATPLNTDNTLKVTIDGTNVYINQAQVTAANLQADNGVVHVLNGVVLPAQTVADVALGSTAHTTLVAAVVEARLLPALTNPFSQLTVFAPTNDAFTAALTALGITAGELLASPNLSDILLYHVLGAEVVSGSLTNGQIAAPLNTANTLKVTIDGTDVFINQAQVTAANLQADNGVVHVLNAVVLPSETVADIALGSSAHTSLVAAVVEARLLPALSNPFASLTVFAPTNTAFDNLATALGTDLAGVLAHPQLTDILLYHVVGSEVVSTALVNGPVVTLNGQSVTINLMSGVMVNNATVTAADLPSDNGVVHVIDAVLVPSLANISELSAANLEVSPNPSSDIIKISNISATDFSIINNNGSVVKSGKVVNNEVSVSDLDNGNYFLQLTNNSGIYQAKFIKM
ncbi:MAG: fasciclin domain-containing protein [Crocinitomicaceae bacterium]|nr:fasciclin domain-containing protein [Crocinitomicaceae bacterium]